MGALDGSVAMRLRAAAARCDPGLASIGVLHTGLCPENLVVDPTGVLRAIDNETCGSVRRASTSRGPGIGGHVRG
jgi:hypothetical protein